MQKRRCVIIRHVLSASHKAEVAKKAKQKAKQTSIVTARAHLPLAEKAAVCVPEDASTRRVELLEVTSGSASSNTIAMNIFNPVFPLHATLLCLPHGIDNIGVKASHQELTKMITLFTAIMCKSPTARGYYREDVGVATLRTSFSKTRWWSWFDIAW